MSEGPELEICNNYHSLYEEVVRWAETIGKSDEFVVLASIDIIICIKYDFIAYLSP
jgi:hypothetical protein